MQGLELAVVLLTAAAGLRVLAGQLNLPHPVLLVFGGLALAAIPGLPRIGIEPDTLFLLFIPPLLYLAAFTTSLRDFRAQLCPSPDTVRSWCWSPSSPSPPWRTHWFPRSPGPLPSCSAPSSRRPTPWPPSRSCVASARRAGS
jgi:hypothetical protein